jgi:hypothetical protein
MKVILVMSLNSHVSLTEWTELCDQYKTHTGRDLHSDIKYMQSMTVIKDIILLAFPKEGTAINKNSAKENAKRVQKGLVKTSLYHNGDLLDVLKDLKTVPFDIGREYFKDLNTTLMTITHGIDLQYSFVLVDLDMLTRIAALISLETIIPGKSLYNRYYSESIAEIDQSNKSLL